MPVTHIDFEGTKAEVGLVNASAHDNPGADRKLKICAVEPDRAGAIGEKVGFISRSSGYASNQRYVTIILIHIIACGDDPTDSREVVGGSGLGKRGGNSKQQ